MISHAKAGFAKNGCAPCVKRMFRKCRNGMTGTAFPLPSLDIGPEHSFHRSGETNARRSISLAHQDQVLSVLGMAAQP
jgi:hypothetical protein